jgi:catechol 2,3-dioxygenase-like lactoylglutathione lyase family enzyme
VINENALRISPRRASGSAIVFGSIVIFFILTYAKPYYLLKSILDDTCLPPARAKLKKSEMLNTETVIHPKLQHLGLTTGNLQPLLAWYKTVLGMRLIYLSENPIGAPTDSTPSIKAVWLSNDEANHRIAVVEISGLVADPERPRHQRLQHVAFAYSTLDDLLDTYVRLKALGILPAIQSMKGRRPPFIMKTRIGTASSSTSATTPKPGHRSSTSRTRLNSPVVRLASMSIRKGWSPRTRQAPAHGNCTSAPGKATSRRPSPTIPRYYCEKRLHHESLQAVIGLTVVSEPLQKIPAKDVLFRDFALEEGRVSCSR